MPHTALELIPLSVATQRDAIVTGAVDIALVRQPIDREGLQLIPLYDEVPVVVMAVDATLSAADELDAADLAGEVLISSRDDVLGYTTPGTRPPAFAMPETTADAVATVAAGVGIAVMPMSLARLHHRKDVTYRVLRGGPVSSIALAWDADRTTPLVDTFVGIVRGRTANSSR
jgi:DNA-binding transcriptional LysR family regulator